MQVEGERFLIDDVFEIKEKPYLEKFIKTARLIGDSTIQEGMNVEFDAHNDLYKISVGEKHRIVISPSFDKDIDTQFQYVMYGKLFEIKLEEDKMASIYCSFGGLICRFLAKCQDFSPYIREGLRVYIMFERVE